MKTLAIIGAGYLQEPLVLKATEMGLHTICFAWEDGAVCKKLADEFYPISVVDKEKILAVCKEKRIDGICTIASDVAAPTVAYVADKMGLNGNNYEAAVRASDKFIMRNSFMKAGIACPKFIKCSRNNSRNIISIAKRSAMELPLIVKPTDRSGSLGVRLVEMWENLQSAVEFAIEKSFAKEAIVEEYIEGREISVEFISYRGKHYPLQITDKVTTGAPHFVELEHHQPSTLPPEMYKRVYNITDRALTTLGLTDGASHSEYKITEDGCIVMMEIGGRMGGDFIGSDLVRLSTGYDYTRGVIDVALGCFQEPSTYNSQTINENHSGVFFLCEETTPLLPKIQDAIAHPALHPEVIRAAIMDCNLKQVQCSADRSGYMIYQTDNLSKIKRL